MVIVIQRGYRLTIAKVLSVFALISTALLGRPLFAHAESTVANSAIAQVFKDAHVPVSTKLAGGGGGCCYGEGAYYGQGSYYGQGTYYSQGYYQGYYQSYYQGYYQSYYQGYYQSSYQTTFTKNVAASGSFAVTGSISKGSGTFVIDYPLDPGNKLLYHSFVESPDVKNLYDGIAMLDKNGEATVQLPHYFDALNNEVRYQLKPIGASMPNLYVKEEEHDNQFGIGGGVPGGKVSWQVTGIRHDAYIKANPIVPVVEKGPEQLVNKGEYLFPAGYVHPFPLSGLVSSAAAYVERLFSKQ